MRGGRRPGSGRKRKPDSLRSLQAHARVLAHPSSVISSPGDVFEPSVVDLTPDERLIWRNQAPHAFANGTLTRASELAFTRYCRLVVYERAEAASSGRLGTNHRGVLKDLNTLELQFGLTPCGKPMTDAAPAPSAVPLSGLAKFR
jgi:hypothetical protein